MFEAARIADALVPSGSRVARRNRLIKRALADRFGYKNVSVKGDRGTGYGWVDIKVKVKKPHSGECDWRCQMCRSEEDKVKSEVWSILKETGLYKELYTYFDDMGEGRKECIVTVELY